MAKNPRKRKISIPKIDLPEKANLILNVILVAFILIILRVWYLSVIQYEQRLEESRKPQKRVIMESAKRGTIRDRFNIPLATNRIQYQAAVLYAPLKEIPFFKTEIASDGKKIKKFKRKEYVSQLSQLLADELNLDAERIEDLIYAKAAFFTHVPYVIKEDLTEREYYRLKILEKDWPGILVQKTSKRFYPMGKTAGDIIGYMGAINKSEYEKVTSQLKGLERWIENFEMGLDEPFPEGVHSWEQAQRRLKDLQEKAYSITDFVGKSGIEGFFEEELRGYRGKKIYFSDSKGNFLKELAGSRKPQSGKRLLLTISSELQEFAEKLLIQNEAIREAKVSKKEKRSQQEQRQPWIKGGAIIAMDPNNGEIIAMASHPRFDPNDFISSGDQEIKKQKRSQIQRWFENEQYLADIWDQKKTLEREIYDAKKDAVVEEGSLLTWQFFLQTILPKNHAVLKILKEKPTLNDAYLIQKTLQTVLSTTQCSNLYPLLNLIYPEEDGHQPYQKKGYSAKEAELRKSLKIEDQNKIKALLDPFFGELFHNYDKVLLADLYQLVLDPKLCNEELLSIKGTQPIELFRDASAAVTILEDQVKSMLKMLFHEHHFKGWRKAHEKIFLKEVREKELEKKQYHRPYIDHFDHIENLFFQNFWSQHRLKFLEAFLKGNTSAENDTSLTPYLNFLYSWHREINMGAHQAISWLPFYHTLQKATEDLDKINLGYYLSALRCYQDLNRPLLGKYPFLRKNPDQTQLEKHLAVGFYPVYGFGYGRSTAYRQATTQGSIFKLVTAYEGLSQKFQQLNELYPSFEKLNPLTMIDQVFRKGKQLFVGYHMDGTPIPQMYKGGRLLKSSISQIGKIDVLKALETSSNPYFSLLAGEVFDSPQDLYKAANQFGFGDLTNIQLPYEIKGKLPSDLEHNRTGLYAMANGQHTLVVTPLQTCVMLSAIANGGKILQPKILKMSVGKRRTKSEKSLQDCLNLLNIQYPVFEKFFTEEQGDDSITSFPTTIKRQLFMPSIIRNILLEGMRRVVNRQLNESLMSLSKIYKKQPEAISDYLDLQNQLIGKTSTAEKLETLDCDLQYGTNIYTHVWFGGISFLDDCNDPEIVVFRDRFGRPELIVVVYLRFGTWGKEAAPLAAQIVKKWREIKAKHQNQ